MNTTQKFADQEQLELGFAGVARPKRTGPRTGVTPARAQWWFSQIRAVLAQAAGRTPPGRPEQVCLTLPARAAAGWPRRAPEYRLAPVWGS